MLVIRSGIRSLLVAGILIPLTLLAQDSPHWDKNACQACHIEPAPDSGMFDLREADAEALCEMCHGDRGDAKPCRHASDLHVGNMTVADSLQSSLKNERVVCSTCHDIVYQCEHPRIQYSYQNPGFLRDRTTRQTGKYCMKCHEPASYAELNPHDGIAGVPPKPTCLLCHEDIPQTSATGDIKAAFNMQDDLNDSCRGCHAIGPHPSSSFTRKASDEWLHLVIPSTEVLSNMEQFRAEHGVVLPLHPETGEVFCGTCHNQHGFMSEFGEPQAPKRLRVNDICRGCHAK